MPSKPLRPCRHPGCCRLTPGGYCPEHQPAKAERSDESKTWRWLYGTKQWQSLRGNHLLAEPFCRQCAKQGERVWATDVDHILDHKGNLELFYDPSNLQSLCHSCHSRKTLAEIKKNKSKKRTR